MSDSTQEGGEAVFEDINANVLKRSPGMVLAAVEPKNHPFEIPGTFALPGGQTVWIEKEFDYSNQMDAADAAYEEQMEMYNNGDYSYSSAFRQEGYLEKKTAWDSFEEQLNAVHKEYTNRMGALGYDEEGRMLREELRDERTKVREEMVKNGPQKPEYERAKQPVHKFANRIFRIDISDRIIEYRQGDGKKAKQLITGLSALSDYGKVRILETPVRLGELVPRTWWHNTNFSLWIKKNFGRGGGYGYIPTDKKKELAERPVIPYDSTADNVSGYKSMVAWDAKADADTQIAKDSEVYWYNTHVPYDIVNAIKHIEGSNDPNNWVKIREEWIDTTDEALESAKKLSLVLTDMYNNGNIKRGRAFDQTWTIEENLTIPAHAIGNIKSVADKMRQAVADSDSFANGGAKHLEERGSGAHSLDMIDTRRPDKKSGKMAMSDITRRFLLMEGDKYQSYKKNVHNTAKTFAEATPQDMPMVPHMNEDINLMPHQALAGAKITSTDRAIVDVDMGGGKTSMFFSDAMVALSTGRAKKVGIVMPTNTIPQQVDELIHKFGRNINVIGLTNKAFRKYGKGQEGFNNLKKQLLAAPPNTIVLIAYEWLGQRPNIIRTGIENKNGKEKTIKDYHRGRFLTDQCGVDMIILDECHRIKNPETARSAAVLGLSGAKVKRVGSGTMTPNTPDDIVGPLQFVDPMIFGSKETFAKKFDIGMVRGKVTSIPPNTLKKIREELLDYGMVSMRRTSWMHMLPKRTEKVHKVRLPKHLQDLYEALYKATIDRIMGDPNLKKMWDKFKEDVGAEDTDIGGEGGGLLQILGRLDQFVTAPDSPIGGDLEALIQDMNSEDENKSEAAKKKMGSLGAELVKVRGIIAGLPDEDKISPKCYKAAEIIDRHFSNPSNMLTDRNTGDEYYGKVLIFVDNIGSAKHFQKFIPQLCKTVSAEEVAFFKADNAGRRDLEVFKDKRSKYKVLCAVDWALREGHNLQMGNRLIRASLKWTPGDMEQTYARIYRPGSEASEVYIDILVTENTIEVAKYGRLLSKYDAMRRVNSDFTDDSTEALSPISMNYDNMEKYTSVSQLEDYISRYDAAAEHDAREAKRMAERLGTDMVDVSGPDLPGAARIPGELPYYDEEDIYRPIRAKLIKGINGKKDMIVVDDDESMEYLNKSIGKKLGLRYKDDGSGGYFIGPAPTDIGTWAKTAETLGLDPSVSSSDAVPAPISKAMVEKANNPAPRRKKVKKQPKKNTTSWETVAVFSGAEGVYTLYRQPFTTAEGKDTKQYVLAFHSDGLIGNPATGTSLANFFAASTDPSQIGGVPARAWERVNQRVSKHNEDNPIPAWASPTEAIEDVVEEIDDIEPIAKSTLPPNVIGSLRFLSYDGVKYIAVDADDETAPDMRPFGIVWFNAFYQRPFVNMKEARRILKQVGATGLSIEDSDEFFENARDAIWGKKVPKRKLMREQLLAMKNRRRSLTKGIVSAHYVQFEGQHHIAINALENRADLAKVRGVNRFNRISAGYWMPCVDRSVVRNLVKKLYTSGYRVAYWKEFVEKSKEWFSYTPEFDLSVPDEVRNSIPAPAPTGAPPADPVAPKVKSTKPKRKPSAKAGKLSPGKVKTLQDVGAANIQGISAVLEYGGKGAYNIAVIQSLINKDYMTGEKDTAIKSYVDCALTKKGADAVNMVHTVPGTDAEPAVEDVPAPVVEPDPVVEDISPVTPDVQEEPSDAEEVFDADQTQESQEEAIVEEVSSDLNSLVEDATGPKWVLKSNEIMDDFEPKAVWLNEAKTKQIKIYEEDEGSWMLIRINKVDGKRRKKSHTFSTLEESINKAKSIMNPMIPDISGSETGKVTFANVTPDNFEAKVLRKRNNGSSVWSMTGPDFVTETKVLSEKKSDDPRPRYQIVSVFEEDGVLKWEFPYINTTISPQAALKKWHTYNDRSDNGYSKIKPIIVPIQMSRAR